MIEGIRAVGSGPLLLCLALIGSALVQPGGAASAPSVTVPPHSQGTATPSYGAYIGMPSTWTPLQSLSQSGIKAQLGVRARQWCTGGFDFTRVAGMTRLTTTEMPAALRTQLQVRTANLQAAGLLPPGYQFQISGAISSMLLGFGPQLNTRMDRMFVLFVNPDLGGLREQLTPRPHDPFTQAVARSVIPSGEKVDWTPFYGAGGGVEFRVQHHIGIRSMLDVVYSHPFNDLIANGSWNYRVSTGFSFDFGSHRGAE